MADAPAPTPAETAFAFRCLLRATRAGTLATATSEGHPFASLVTPAFMPDLSPVLLLSALSEHTRQLKAEARCAVMVVGPAAEANPQTAPRITLICTAAVDTDPALRSRYLAIHPYATLYADFGDFAFWRLKILRASFVGGFARAGRFAAVDLVPPADAVAQVLDSEAAVLSHCNTDHADALAAIAGGGEGWRMVTADTDGCDLAHGEEAVIRIAWDSPVIDSAGIRAALIAKVAAARNR
jgi:putative heme iron utilization protein